LRFLPIPASRETLEAMVKACGFRRFAMDSIEYVGLVASSLATLAFLPQVVKTWRSRSAHDFSLATLLMLEAGTSLWIVYGLSRDAPAIWLGNGVTFALAGFILLVKLRSVLASIGSPAEETKPSGL
jgi:MtN3 and saliva related transmembrane protein